MFLFVFGPVPSAVAAWPPEGFPLCALPGAQYGPLVTFTGGSFVVWTDERDGHRQLYARDVGRLLPAPTWPAGGVRIAPSAWDQLTPATESSAYDGSLYVVWSEDRGNGTGPDLYLQRFLSDGSRAPGWPEDGLVLCDAPGAQVNPSLSAEGSSALVSWQDERNGNSDVYAQIVLRSGVLKTGWPANGFAVSTDPHEERFISVRQAAFGITFGWERAGRIVMQQIDDWSGPARSYYWPEGGLVVSDTTLVASNLVMARNPVYWELELAWEEFDASRSQVRFLHMPGSAQQPSFTGSVAVAPDAESNQLDPRVLVDYFNHVSVVWQDDRADAGDIYQQVYDLVGNPSVAEPLFGSEGEPVCVAEGRQHAPAVSLNVYWVDERGGASAATLYGRRRVFPGGPLEPNSVPVALATGAQSSPTADHYKGISVPDLPRYYDHVAWTDTRDPATAPDIYVQAFGYQIDYLYLGSGPSAVPSAVALSAARPTPATGPVTVTLSLAWAAEASLDVVDVSGRLVRELAHTTLPAGRHDLTWDGRDRHGLPAAPGIYFVRGHAAGQVLSRRVVRLAH